MEKTFDQVAIKIKRIEKEAPKIKWVQLDIMDGLFVHTATWSDPDDLSKIKTCLNLEAHLMIQKPWNAVLHWLGQRNVKRILVHRESVIDNSQLDELINTVKCAGREFGIVLNPDTSIESIKSYLPILDEVLLMAVLPGFSGQKFQNKILDKICVLRQFNSRIPIGIDGGVNLETAPLAIKAGANRLCATSFLWNSNNLSKAILALREL